MSSATSARAAVRIASPATTPGSTAALRASEPNSAMGMAPRTTVAHSGTGATDPALALEQEASSTMP